MTSPYYTTSLGKLYNGDCLELMKEIPDGSVDLVLTDPPYGLSFMGRSWDEAVPPIDVWKECIRVLKPGAFAFVMSSPRLDCLSQMAIRMEQAGFDMGFTPIYWAYAQGFPKSTNISKAIDRQACREELRTKLGREPTKEEFKEAWKGFREVIGKGYGTSLNYQNKINQEQGFRPNDYYEDRQGEFTITKPRTPMAQALDGSYAGFQPKPAVEVIIVAMKPLDKKTFVEQAIANGHGITWLDDGRIPITSNSDKEEYDFNRRGYHERYQGQDHPYDGGWKPQNVEVGNITGRFPANLLVSDDALNDGKVSTSTGGSSSLGAFRNGNIFGKGRDERWDTDPGYGDSGSFSRYYDLDEWFKDRIKQLPKDVQKVFPFLLVPKASKGERDEDCEDALPQRMRYEDRRGQSHDIFNTEGNGRNTDNRPVRNIHPTVKPVALMSYLITLGSRPNDVVLDPYIGSGTTGIACELFNRQYRGIEISKEYCDIAVKRLEKWKGQQRLDVTL